ncbi:MAG: hypothetical protein PUE48_00730 [Eubacterium coprostanoligenes]|uniref:hypothetical protein n=1 Tax=Eubacterium coprostanoligenes TaxID=290054 RepID=UPI00240A4744|nr:hypothetical protein [Eubacterium coprostanoligenes]MDD6664856.1 hypothetical protein [Eubacterium coprostanoligenes]
MNFTKYIGMYQSFIKDKRIHLKQNTIETFKSEPHFYKTFTYENRNGVLNTGLFISVKEIINNESEILDIFKDYFKSASINESSYNKVKFDLEALIIDKSVEKKCNFNEGQELTVLGVLKGFIIFNNDENFFVLDDDELELEVNEILSDLDDKGYV